MRTGGSTNASRHKISTGHYIPIPCDPPQGMDSERCQELETAIARGATDLDLAGKHEASPVEILRMRQRMEQFA